MNESETRTIHVQMDAKCPRCGMGGATGVDGKGVCLTCAAASMAQMSAADDKRWARRPDVEAVIDYCVQRWHHHLARANIVALGRPKATKKDGRDVWARIKRASKLERVIYSEDGEGIDYILVVAADVWDTLPKEQRIALVDHELCHAAGQDLDTGEWGIAGHDLEEFRAVIQRHGAWRADVELFIETAKRVVLPQMTLDEAAKAQASEA